MFSKFDALYKALIGEDAVGAGAGGMSSGPVLAASMSAPASSEAVYVLMKGNEKKHFKTEAEKRDFLRDNADWKEVSGN